MLSRHAGSRRASRRDSSAAAAYSHSVQVGRRAPSDSQYAFAANQLTQVTGCSACASEANAVGEAQCDRYRGSANTLATRSRRHSGCVLTKARNCAFVTGVRIIAKGATRTPFLLSSYCKADLNVPPDRPT